jgi:hypothetical protein
MADYQNPQQNHDPAGSTQMFRAFVDDGSTTAREQPTGATTYGSARGPRTGLIVGVVVAVVVIAAVVYFAMA